MEQDNQEMQKKESKVNINMRVKESLRLKIKEQMAIDEKDPDDFFSEMFYNYLTTQAVTNGAADYSQDITELEMTSRRILTIFQNMIEKSYMQNSILSENHSNHLNETTQLLSSQYEDKIQQLTTQLNSVQKEYNLISTEAHALINDNKEVKQTIELAKKHNKKNEELLESYKQQIENQKTTISFLEQKLENTTDASLLEKTILEYEKSMLSVEKSSQEKLQDLQNKFNELQIKYIELLNAKK